MNLGWQVKYFETLFTNKLQNPIRKPAEPMEIPLDDPLDEPQPCPKDSWASNLISCDVRYIQIPETGTATEKAKSTKSLYSFTRRSPRKTITIKEGFVSELSLDGGATPEESG